MKKIKLLGTFLFTAPLACTASFLGTIVTKNANHNFKNFAKTNNAAYQFKHYSKKLGLLSNCIQSIYTSKDNNNVYIGTDKGVSIGHKAASKWVFQNYKGPFDNSSDIKSLYATSDNKTLFIATPWGLTVGHLKNGKWEFKTSYDKDSGLPAWWVSSVSSVNNGRTIFVGTQGGFCVGTLQKNGKYTFTVYKNIVSKNVWNLYVIKNGETVFIATNNGMSVGTLNSSGKYTFVNYVSGLSSRVINSIYATPDGSTIFLGTVFATNVAKNGGLSVGILKNGRYSFTNYDKKDGLGSNHINSVYGTSDGKTVYVGASEVFGRSPGGLSVGTLQSNGKFTFKQMLPLALPDAIYSPDNGKTLYVGDWLAGMYIGTKID